MAKQKEAMPSNGIRMPAEMWAKCDEMTAKLGLESRNEYIRNAIEFYTEWNERTSTQKFLTPALESVIGAKVRDSENRIARVLYKMAVQQNAMTHVLATAYNWTEKELSDLYDTAEDDAKGWNGTLDLRSFDYEEDE
jgi:metal-responsive CopG/Arc/MetJ family transcriptional regulator